MHQSLTIHLKTPVLKKCPNFTGKQPCGSVFFDKVAVSSSAILRKETPT